MACHHPVEVAILRKETRPGERRQRTLQTVPCGKCLGCRKQQKLEWGIRVMHEAQMHDHSFFLTLTYDGQRLPEHGTLVPEDFRLFIRRVRNHFSETEVSYFGCGEYGDERQRPHYHTVLFGPDFPDKYLHDYRDGFPVWRSPTLEALWPAGLSELGSVTIKSAQYVAGYISKKFDYDENPNLYERVDPLSGELHDVLPEFARMSLKPAIGLRWLKKYWSDIYPRDYVVVEGRKYKPPRYYDKAFENPAYEFEGISYPQRVEMLNEVRKKRAERQEEQWIKEVEFYGYDAAMEQPERRRKAQKVIDETRSKLNLSKRKKF